MAITCSASILPPSCLDCTVSAGYRSVLEFLYHGTLIGLPLESLRYRVVLKADNTDGCPNIACTFFVCSPVEVLMSLLSPAVKSCNCPSSCFFVVSQAVWAISAMTGSLSNATDPLLSRNPSLWRLRAQHLLPVTHSVFKCHVSGILLLHRVLSEDVGRPFT